MLMKTLRIIIITIKSIRKNQTKCKRFYLASILYDAMEWLKKKSQFYRAIKLSILCNEKQL